MPSRAANPPIDADEDRRRHPAAPKPPLRLHDDAEAIAVAAELAERFKAGASERDRERRLPWDEVAHYTASGLGGITIPRDYGGADVSYVTLAKVFEILCAADPALGQIPQNQFGVLQMIREYGSSDQKARIFGDVLKGYRIGNAGPERGRNAVNHSTTRVTLTPQGYRLTGTRFYSTGSMFAHWIPTRAVDDQGRAVQVWAAHNAPGVTVVDDWNSFGQRTTASGTVEFDNVPVDDSLIIPVWSFADRPGLSGPVSQLIQAAIDSGIAIAAIGDTIDFVKTYARPWMDSGLQSASDDPTIIHEIGALQTDLHAAQELLYKAAARLDDISTRPITEALSAEASIAVAEAKILTTEAALDAAEKLFDLSGSSATRAKHNLDRHWRNARVHTLHDPVRWKYHLLGNYDLNGVFPARHQWN
jgi:SfnB family sulfur acquisition oxidoreductase